MTTPETTVDMGTMQPLPKMHNLRQRKAKQDRRSRSKHLKSVVGFMPAMPDGYPDVKIACKNFWIKRGIEEPKEVFVFGNKTQ